jgi:peptide-methionine (S)-S-oxide reductase
MFDRSNLFSLLRRLGAGLAIVPVLAAILFVTARAEEAPRALPMPVLDTKAPVNGSVETAVLAGGCFWGVEGVFQHVKGVKAVLAGYSGGNSSNANYEAVSGEGTGHAESVQIKFDPREISYGQILRVFFSVAQDPTELNRQGPDEGTSYRSDIFYATAEQERIAKAYIAQLEKAHAFSHPIVTRVDALTEFYPAEAYHQDFLIRNPHYPYIVFNDLPKIANLKRLLPEVYREQPATGASAS